MVYGSSKIKFADYSGAQSISTQIYSVSENYLEVVDSDYFYPVEEEEAIKKELPSLGRNKPDVVKALYSDTGISPTQDGTQDPYDITYRTYTWYWGYPNITEQIKVIVPDGIRAPLSLSTKRGAQIGFPAYSYGYNFKFRAVVRAMVKKMPGFLFFTSYQTAALLNQALLSTD